MTRSTFTLPMIAAFSLLAGCSSSLNDPDRATLERTRQDAAAARTAAEEASRSAAEAAASAKASADAASAASERADRAFQRSQRKPGA